MSSVLVDNAKGCLTGLAIGDALGVPTEGKSPGEIKKQFGFVSDFVEDKPSGSDDTEFALFNAMILLKHGKEINANIIAEEWREFIVPHEGQYKGAGFSEMMAIENLKKGLKSPQSGMHAHSWSDGLAMRVAPFAVVFPGEPDKACKLAYEDGSVTHSGEGIYSGMAVAAAISEAMINSSLEKIFSSALESVPKNTWTYRAMERGIRIGKNSSSLEEALFKLHDEIACNYYHWADLGPEAVGLAFGIMAAAKGDFSDSVLGGVNIGRDTDTIAAIAGAVIGAKIGYNNIPVKWSSRINNINGNCISIVKDCNLVAIARQLVESLD